MAVLTLTKIRIIKKQELSQINFVMKLIVTGT